MNVHLCSHRHSVLSQARPWGPDERSSLSLICTAEPGAKVGRHQAEPGGPPGRKPTAERRCPVGLRALLWILRSSECLPTCLHELMGKESVSCLPKELCGEVLCFSSLETVRLLPSRLQSLNSSEKEETTQKQLRNNHSCSYFFTALHRVTPRGCFPAPVFGLQCLQQGDGGDLVARCQCTQCELAGCVVAESVFSNYATSSDGR